MLRVAGAALALIVALPASAGTVGLAWDPITQLDGCVEPCGYRIYWRAPDEGFAPERRVEVGPDETNVTVEVPDAPRLWFAVTAFNEAGESRALCDHDDDPATPPARDSSCPIGYSNEVVKDFDAPLPPIMLQRIDMIVTLKFGAPGTVEDAELTLTGLRVALPSEGSE